MDPPGLQKNEPAIDLSVVSPIFGSTSWLGAARHPRLALLYEKGKSQQWNATTDIDWSMPTAPDAPWPDDSYFVRSSFDRSPLARYGQRLWGTFRAEFEAWMISQFLPGEQAALVGAARVLGAIPDTDARFCLASQVAEEARHLEVFSRYIRERVSAPYTVSPPLARLLRDTINDARWDVMVLGLHILVEALAMATLRLADRTFHDALIRQICRLVARDEARHVSLGVISLEGFYSKLSEAELSDRREFVVEALHLVSRRFLFEDIWDRLGVPRAEGVEFATTNDVMTKYRQTVCAKVISGLVRVGLMNKDVLDQLTRLGLLGLSGTRAVLLGRSGNV
jgi:hypothetical protein